MGCAHMGGACLSNQIVVYLCSVALWCRTTLCSVPRFVRHLQVCLNIKGWDCEMKKTESFGRTEPVRVSCVCSCDLTFPTLCSHAGDAAPVSVLHQCQGERMGDGIPNWLHQSYRGSSRQRGSISWAEEWSCEFITHIKYFRWQKMT